MKNKGFTLIELLAVIVILAIIALIATPIILNIIDDTKDQSVKRSIDHYMSAATTAIARSNLKDTANGVSPKTCGINPNGNLACPGYDEIIVDIDGEKPTGGTITFQNGKITEINITMPNGNAYEFDEKGNIVLVGSGEGTGGGTETPIPQNLIPTGGLYYVNVTGPSGGNLEWSVTTAETKYSAGDSFPTSKVNDVYVYDGWIYIFGGSGSRGAAPTLILEDDTRIGNVYTSNGSTWGAAKYGGDSAGPMLTTLNGVSVFEIDRF